LCVPIAAVRVDPGHGRGNGSVFEGLQSGAEAGPCLAAGRAAVPLLLPARENQSQGAQPGCERHCSFFPFWRRSAISWKSKRTGRADRALGQCLAGEEHAWRLDLTGRLSWSVETLFALGRTADQPD